MNNYVVYRHLKLNGEIFYIGMGDPKRPYNRSGRSVYWHNIVNKHGRIVEILAENLSCEEAYILEIKLVAFYGRRDLNKGTLVNLTDGGEGSNKSKRSEEAKEKTRITRSLWSEERKKEVSEKLSKAHKGKKLSEEHRLKLSEINKDNQHCLGRTYTDEQKLNLSIKNKGKVHIHTEEGLKNVQKNQFKIGNSIHNKKVINIITGEIFESAKGCHILTKSTYSRNHFRDMISGLKTNKTNYKYLKDYEQ